MAHSISDIEIWPASVKFNHQKNNSVSQNTIPAYSTFLWERGKRPYQNLDNHNWWSVSIITLQYEEVLSPNYFPLKLTMLL